MSARTITRAIVTLIAFVLGTAIAVPIIQANVQELAKARGWDQFLVAHWPAMVKWAEITQSPWLIFAAGFFIGGAICMWLDYYLRGKPRAVDPSIRSARLRIRFPESSLAAEALQKKNISAHYSLALAKSDSPVPEIGWTALYIIFERRFSNNPRFRIRVETDPAPVHEIKYSSPRGAIIMFTGSLFNKVVDVEVY
jgi:hypothetical protein